MKSVLLVFSALALLTSSAFAVDGGTAVDANSAIAKSAISLGDISGGTLTRSYCSGVIVSPHTIITAAHCLAGKDPTTIMVLFGPNGNTTTVMRLGAESHIQRTEINCQMPKIITTSEF
jgi:V8-like Glu-specific endopeptidase